MECEAVEMDARCAFCSFCGSGLGSVWGHKRSRSKFNLSYSEEMLAYPEFVQSQESPESLVGFRINNSPWEAALQCGRFFYFQTETEVTHELLAPPHGTALRQGNSSAAPARLSNT